MQVSKILTPFVLTLGIAAAASAFAKDDNDYPQAPTATSTISRAEVLAELAQAIQDGRIPIHENDYPMHDTPYTSSMTRADVQREALDSRPGGYAAIGDN